MATISELAKRQAELVAELEAVREEIASRHGEIETADADTSAVETATPPTAHTKK